MRINRAGLFLAFITVTVLAGPVYAQVCGNNTIEAGEQCDGTDLGGYTCDSFGELQDGTLACDGNCKFDLTGCISPKCQAAGSSIDEAYYGYSDAECPFNTVLDAGSGWAVYWITTHCTPDSRWEYNHYYHAAGDLAGDYWNSGGGDNPGTNTRNSTLGPTAHMKVYVPGSVTDYDFDWVSYSCAHSGPTEVTGDILSHKVWSQANSPYIIKSNVTVKPGKFLVIEPGVEVKFDGNYHLRVEGVLYAVGTPADPITFTSNQGSPAAGDWNKIVYASNSIDIYNKIAYARIEYAATGLEINGASPAVEDTTFEDNVTGIRINNGSNPVIRNNTIINNTADGIFLNSTADNLYPDPIIHHNSIYDNTNYNLRAEGSASFNYSSFTVDARFNWWNTTNTATIAGTIFDNADDATKAVVNIDPVLAAAGGDPVGCLAGPLTGTVSSDASLCLSNAPYLVTGNVTVNNGVTLSVEPGVEVRFDGNYAITVNGTLDAQGLSGNLITFTSDQATPAAQDWDKIYLSSGSSGHTIDYVRVEYADEGIEAESITVNVTNSVFDNNYNGVVLRNSVGSLVSGGTFTNMINHAVILDRGDSTVDNNTFTDNWRGVWVNGDGATGTVTNNVIENSTDAGIIVTDGHALITGNTVINGATYGVQCSEYIEAGLIDCVVNNNQLYGNAVADFRTIPFNSVDVSNIVLDAKNNWWGTTDASLIMTRILDNFDDPLAPQVDFGNYLDGPNGTPVGETFVTGNISSNTTWTLANSPYAVLGNVAVDAGVTLTIEPGVIARFMGYSSLVVDGTLTAQGTPADKILFTSINSSPAPGDWNRIQLKSTAGSSVVEYVRVEYADEGLLLENLNLTVQNNEFINNTQGVTLKEDSPATVTDNVFQYGNRGIQVENDSLSYYPQATISNNVSSDNTVGIYVLGRARPVITGNTLSNNNQGVILSTESSDINLYPADTVINNNSLTNSSSALIMALESHPATPDFSSVVIDAKNNWFGTTSFAAILGETFDYFEQSYLPHLDISEPLDGPAGTPLDYHMHFADITANATWNSNSIHMLQDDLTINSGVTLNVDEGADVKIAGDYFIDVQGTLNVTGTEANKVHFSFYPDTSAADQWQYINLSGTSVITHALIENADDGLVIDNVSPSVTESTLRNNVRGIFITNGSSAVITDNHIEDNTTGVYIQPSLANATSITFADNQLENNASYHLFASGDLNYSAETIVAENNWWGSANAATIETSIYHQVDNANSPLVDFDPFLTSADIIQITNVSNAPQLIDPVLAEMSTLSFTLSKASGVTIDLYKVGVVTDVYGNGVFFKEFERNLITDVSYPAGVNTYDWDGLDGLGQVAEHSAYVYKIKADADDGSGYDIFDPAYVQGTVSVSGNSISPSSYDPYANEEVFVNYTLSVPAWVTIGGEAGSQFSGYFLEGVPRDAGAHSEIWDGRDGEGNIMPQSFTMSMKTTIMPEVVTIVEDSGFEISALTTEPYLINVVYNEVATVKYTLSRTSDVVIRVFDPNGNNWQVTQANGQAAGNYEYVWEGVDFFGDKPATEGNYRIEVTAVDPVNGTAAVRSANVIVYR